MLFIYRFLYRYVYMFCFLFLSKNLLCADSTLILNQLSIVRKLEKGINAMYNWQFDSADSIYAILSKEVAHHPVIPFFKSQLILWKNSPIDYQSAIFRDIENLLMKTIYISEKILTQDKQHLEAIFFKMSSHALLALFYRDNGEIFKAVAQARWVLKYLSNAKQLKEELRDFYLSIGLYNYFREAFPEKYPIYKPLVIFFPSGDKKTGINQIYYSATNGLFSHAEALHFLTEIYLEYEYNKQKAIQSAHNLVKLYPQNQYFYIKYIEVLVLVKDFEKAQHQINLSKENRGNIDRNFYKVASQVLQAMIYDLQNHNLEEAKRLYLISKEEIEDIPQSEVHFKAYIYMGLSKYCEKEEEKKEYQQLSQKYDKDNILKTLERYE